jgi:protein-tyrosine phosphatase
VQRAELHFHLLPEVDDGPVDLDDAVELARLAVADGTSVVTVTPHVRDLLALGILAEIPARVREAATPPASSPRRPSCAPAGSER